MTLTILCSNITKVANIITVAENIENDNSHTLCKVVTTVLPFRTKSWNRFLAEKLVSQSTDAKNGSLQSGEKVRLFWWLHLEWYTHVQSVGQWLQWCKYVASKPLLGYYRTQRITYRKETLTLGSVCCSS